MYYVIASNPILDRKVEPAMRRARRMSKESGKTEHVYGELYYQTQKSWKQERRVIYKAEVVRHPGRDPKDNPGFVVTNLKESPKWLYQKCTVSARSWKIASRNCTTAWKSAAPAAAIRLLGDHRATETRRGGFRDSECRRSASWSLPFSEVRLEFWRTTAEPHTRY
jgi:Transposase DDE domain group 1